MWNILKSRIKESKQRPLTQLKRHFAKQAKGKIKRKRSKTQICKTSQSQN